MTAGAVVTGWAAALLAACSWLLLAGGDPAVRLRAVGAPARAGRAPGPSRSRRGPRSPLAGGALAGALLVAAATGSVVGALVGAAAGWAVSHRAVARRAAQLADRRRALVVELCLALAAELRAGAAPAAALQAAAGGWPELAGLADAAQARPGDAAELLADAADEPGASGLAAVAACWRVSERSGGSLAKSVGRLAEGLRDDEQVRRELAAQLAGPRATAGLLALLPLGGLLVGAGLGADPVGLLLGTPVGWALLASGGLLEAAGLLWTARVVRRAGSA